MTNTIKRVMCVDDDADILEVAKMCLETLAGFDVVCCNSGKEALARVAEVNPDIILLDVMMPELDGPGTLKALLADPASKHIPVVFMTARAQRAELDQYIQMGAASVIPKPFDPMTISEQVIGIWEKFHFDNPEGKN